jgi:hypothetical protein
LNGKRVYKKIARVPLFFSHRTTPQFFKICIVITALIMLSIATVSSSAASVSITTTSRQAKLGIYMYSYFENANAPSTSSPIVVDTQTSIPASSGSYVIPRGTSAYFWTNQFSSAKTIPSGKMTLDLWGGPTPSLDGQASASYSARSGSVSLTTTQTNDLIYVVVSTSSTPTVTMTGGGLSWNLRGSQANGGAGKVWTFYAVSPSILSSATITANLGASQRFVLIAFGISGANTATPFDPNLGSVASSTGTISTASVSFTTTTTNDFVIGALYVNNNPTVTSGSGFSTIAITRYSNQVTGAAENKDGTPAGAQTVSYSLSSSSWAWAIIGDAVVPATSGSTISISAYTTTSAGVNSNTLFSGLNTNTLPSTSGQVATVFAVTSANIPASGYLKVVLTAPPSSEINIQWGNGKPTNFQIAFTYS